MKKQISLAIVSAALMFAAPASQTFTGTITDDMCANADHKDMKMGSDEKCVTECIKGMGGKYVLYDAAQKTTYQLDDQKKSAAFAGQKVKVTGDLKGKTIHVQKIEPAT